MINLENIPELQLNPVTIAYISTIINFRFQAGDVMTTPFLNINLPFDELTIKYGTVFGANDGKRVGELTLIFDNDDKPVYMVIREFVNGILDEKEIEYYMFENHAIDHKQMLGRIRNMKKPQVVIIKEGKPASASMPSNAIH